MNSTQILPEIGEEKYSLFQLRQMLSQEQSSLVFWKDTNSVYQGSNALYSELLGLSHALKIQGLSDKDLFTEFKQVYSQDDTWVLHQKKPKLIQNPTKLKLLGRVMVAGTLAPLTLEPHSDHVIGIVGKLKLVTKLADLPFYQALKKITEDPQHYLDRQKYPVKIDSKNIVQLAKREVECCLHLLSGKTQPEIALAMGLSDRTIEHYINNIKSKLQCETDNRSKAELIQKIIQGDLLRWI